LGTAINNSPQTFGKTLDAKISPNSPDLSWQGCLRVCQVKVFKEKNPDYVSDENVWSHQGKFKNFGVEETWVPGCGQAGVADAYFRNTRPGRRYFVFGGIQKDEERQTSDES
jgi:hypothetical protein